MWTTDPFWTETLLWMTRLSPSHRYILTPDDWIGADSRYMPVDYGVALDAERCTAFAIPKDDVDRLPAWLLKTDFAGARCVFANDVFVVYSSLVEDWEKADQGSVERHSPYFLERHQAVLQGAFYRHGAINPRFRFDLEDAKPVLVINASHMGNFGDELLALGTVTLMEQLFPGAPCWVVRPDFVIPAGVRPRAIVLGGGGVMYDHVANAALFRSELPNITNYFKFGYIARSMGVPFFALGLGSQNPFPSFASIDATHFVREALRDALVLTTRDDRSSRELTSLMEPGGPRAASLPDLAFEIAASTRSVIADRHRKRFAVVGEVLGFPGVFRAIVKAAQEGLYDFEFIAQAIEDPHHGERLRERMAPAGLPFIDINSFSVEDGIDEICSFDGVITTRFHALVVAVANGLPAIALDNPSGKKARLFEDYALAADGHCELMLADDDIDAAVDALGRLAQRKRREPRKLGRDHSDAIKYLARKLNS